MSTFDEMKAYIGLTAEDSACLGEVWPLVERHRAQILDHFYERVRSDPASAAILGAEDQVKRLKAAMGVWMEELFLGPHDDRYFGRRIAIGKRHVEVDLPSRFMFTAMSVMCQDLSDVLYDELPSAQARTAVRAVRRISDLDLAIMTGTYILGREARQLRTLQELIVSHMPCAILLLDTAGFVTAATPLAAHELGKEPCGLHYLEAFREDFVRDAQLGLHVQAALEEARDAIDLRVDLPRGAGVQSWCVSVIALEHESACALVYIDDVTKAMQRDAQLRQAETLAQLGTLSAAVAHELRNPLAGIAGAVQILSSRTQALDEQRPILLKIDKQIRRLDCLVTDLLTFARPGTVHRELVNLFAVASDVASLEESAACPVRVDGQGLAYADPNLVHRILVHLIQNAVQSQGVGPVTVTIRGAVVEVQDRGPGVPGEVRDRIFEPFFTTRARGTGLGLAIAAQAASGMGGSLRLAASAGPGACFVLELPSHAGIG